MAHVLVASCQLKSAAVQAELMRLRATVGDRQMPVSRVSVLDLAAGPRIGRVGAALGFGWHAREWFRRTLEACGHPVDAVVEICSCGHHHLMGAGRMGVPAWRQGAMQSWVDQHAIAAGMLPIETGASWAQAVVDGLGASVGRTQGAATPTPRNLDK